MTQAQFFTLGVVVGIPIAVIALIVYSAWRRADIKSITFERVIDVDDEPSESRTLTDAEKIERLRIENIETVVVGEGIGEVEIPKSVADRISRERTEAVQEMIDYGLPPCIYRYARGKECGLTRSRHSAAMHKYRAPRKRKDRDPKPAPMRRSIL